MARKSDSTDAVEMTKMPNTPKGPYIVNKVPLDISEACSMAEAFSVLPFLMGLDPNQDVATPYELICTSGTRHSGVFVVQLPTRRHNVENSEILQWNCGLLLHDMAQDYKACQAAVKQAFADHLAEPRD